MPFMGLEPTTDCLIPLIQAVEAQAKRAASDLDATAMKWRPPDGGWSVAQILEHLVITTTLYLAPIRGMIDDATPADGPVRPWKPSLMGGLLIRSLVPTAERRLPTVGKLEPGPEPDTDVVGRLLGAFRNVADLLWNAQGIDMRKPRMTSPVSPLVRRLNLGDGFVIVVVHAQRHMRQIERVIATPGFPGGPAAGTL
ncbi:MAG TPA: DinB family protein [Longimicrobiales bacterium]|nr:DinB family protein [Longimicrobiales bacterium]